MTQPSGRRGVVVTHVMEPVLPGAYAVLTLGGATDATRLYAFTLPAAPSPRPGAEPVAPGPPVELSVVQRTGETLTADMPPGSLMAYAISTSDHFDDSAFIVNRPRLDWSLPERVTAGGGARLFGRGLVSPGEYPTPDPLRPCSFGALLAGKTRVVARRHGAAAFIDIPVSRSSGYEAHLAIPAGTEPGDYEFFAHNGLGGDLGWSEPLALCVESAAESWPDRVFDVDAYLTAGRTPDDAIAAALRAIESNGGGVLAFGPRVYPITRTIVVPPRTVLRGAGRDRTMIRLPEQGEVRPPYVAITGERDFAVEDLRIQSVYATLLICAPRFEPSSFEEALAYGADRVPARTRNVAIRRCHLAQRPLAHLDRRADREFARMIEARLRVQGAQALGGFQSLQLSGDHLAVIDNVMIGGGGCVALNRCRHVRVAGNTIKAGPAGTALMCYSRLVWPEGHPAGSAGAEVHDSYCRQVVIEDNDITVHSEHARNLVSLMFGGEDLYVARNHIHDIEPNSDAEALLTHLWSARWKEPRLEMTGPTRGRIIDPAGEVAHERLDGACVDIVAGRGVGQVRRIVKREGDHVEIDRPFRADPDSSSVTVITAPPPFWRLAFVDNRVVSPAVNVIVWGNSCDTVIDGNYTAEGPGITVWSVRFKGDQKVWGGAAFTSVINNVVDHGWSSPRDEAGALAGAVGIITLCSRDITCTDEGFDILGLVIRNNLAKNNTGIGVRVTFPMEGPGSSGTRPWRIHDAGVVVEGNHCRDSVVGVAIEKGARAVERRNTCVNVTFPLVWADAATPPR